MALSGSFAERRLWVGSEGLRIVSTREVKRDDIAERKRIDRLGDPRMLQLILFAKAPLPGFSKTRLIPALGAVGAARLAARLLEHAVAEAFAAAVGPVELCVTPGPKHPVWQAYFARGWGVHWTDQGRGDLGERLARAAWRRVGSGRSVLLAGTDCPQLSADRIREAASFLERSDAVMVPATDGGYVLLGLRRFSPRVFEEVPWSTDRVAAETRARFQELGWSLVELEPLADVDGPEDLRNLLDQGWLSDLNSQNHLLPG